MGESRDELSRALPGVGLGGEPALKHIVIGEAPFALDSGKTGIEKKWFLPANRPETRNVRVGWPWNKPIAVVAR